MNSKWLKRFGILLAAFICLALIFNIWPFSVATGIATKVSDPTAIIQNYQWYHDQYNAIQAQYNNLQVLPENSQERMGAMMVLNNAIGEYNSRSRQITRNLWKSRDLPYQLNIEDFK